MPTTQNANGATTIPQAVPTIVGKQVRRWLTESEQLTAVRDDPEIIKRLMKRKNKPSRNVQLEAVKGNGNMRNYIDPEYQYDFEFLIADKLSKNPSKFKVKRDHHLYMIDHGQIPLDSNFKLVKSVEREAVSKIPRAIYHIDNPSVKIQFLAIQKDPTNIGWIRNPSATVQAAVAAIDPNYLGRVRRNVDRQVAEIYFSQVSELAAAKKLFRAVRSKEAKVYLTLKFPELRK